MRHDHNGTLLCSTGTSSPSAQHDNAMTTTTMPSPSPLSSRLTTRQRRCHNATMTTVTMTMQLPSHDNVVVTLVLACHRCHPCPCIREYDNRHGGEQYGIWRDTADGCAICTLGVQALHCIIGWVLDDVAHYGAGGRVHYLLASLDGCWMHYGIRWMGAS